MLTAALLSLLAAPALAADAPEADAAWGRIVNGQPVKGDAWPAAAALGFDLGRQRMETCTASLITPRLALTAGHCIRELATQGGIPESLIQQYGRLFLGNDVDAASIDSFGYAALTVHPQYGTDSNGSPRNDIAIIELTEEVEGVAPVWFRDTELSAEEAVGTTVTSVGFGITSSSSQSSGGVKRFARLNVADIDSQFLYSFAADNPNDANLCSGDSGGPQYAKVGARWVQWGVHSFVFSNRGGTDPCLVASGSTNVGAFAPWVLKQVERVHGTTDHCEINGYYLDRICDADCDEPDQDCALDVNTDGVVDDAEAADADDDGDGVITPDEADAFLKGGTKGCDQSGGLPAGLGLVALAGLALRRRR